MARSPGKAAGLFFARWTVLIRASRDCAAPCHAARRRRYETASACRRARSSSRPSDCRLSALARAERADQVALVITSVPNSAARSDSPEHIAGRIAHDLGVGAHGAAASAVAFRRRAAATTLETRELPGRLTSWRARSVGASLVVGRLSITASTAAKSTRVISPNRLATWGNCLIILYIFGRLRPYRAQASSIEPLRASTVTVELSFEKDMMRPFLGWDSTAAPRWTGCGDGVGV